MTPYQYLATRCWLHPLSLHTITSNQVCCACCVLCVCVCVCVLLLLLLLLLLCVCLRLCVRYITSSIYPTKHENTNDSATEDYHHFFFFFQSTWKTLTAPTCSSSLVRSSLAKKQHAKSLALPLVLRPVLP